MAVGALGESIRPGAAGSKSVYPMEKKKILGVIPARYQSSRFVGKPLIEICGVPMIKRTYLQAKQSAALDDLVVATDDDRIMDYCRSQQIPAVMTSEACLTGTDRIAEVAKRHPYDLYVNIQGDEPVIDPVSISQVVELYLANGSGYIAYNLYKVITEPALIESNSVVKVIVNEADEMMYMSRLPVPHSKSGKASRFKQQIPVYGFTPGALAVYESHGKSCNESIEDVELLRLVDLGYRVKMAETEAVSIAVDHPEDLARVEEYIRASEGGAPVGR